MRFEGWRQLESWSDIGGSYIGLTKADRRVDANANRDCGTHRMECQERRRGEIGVA